MNSSDPLIKDRGLVSNRGDRETSLKLHRRNSIQRERLDQELKRLEKEQQKCIRRSHLEICSLSRDKKNLVSDIGRLSFSETMSEANGDANEDALTDESSKLTEIRRKSFTPATPTVNMTRRVSLPALFPSGGNSVVAMTTNKDKKDLFLDNKMTREMNRLKKASMRSGKDNSNDLDDRKGKPRIPANAWYHDNQVAKARERSVFERLSSESSMNSKPSGEFFKSMRMRRTFTAPLSPKSSRKSEHK